MRAWTAQDWQGFFSGVALIIGAIGVAVAKILAVIRHVEEKVREVHVAINSRMDQLLEQKGLASQAAGREEERRSVQPGGNIAASAGYPPSDPGSE